MPFGRKSPLEALALPGVILAYKYSQFCQRRREAASRRVTERELSALHHKIVSGQFQTLKSEIKSFKINGKYQCEQQSLEIFIRGLRIFMVSLFD